MKSSHTLQERIFNIIVIVAASLSAFSIIGNFIAGFPMAINIKWIILIFMSGVYALSKRRNPHNKWVELVYFLIIILVILPYGWIDSGGSNNNTLAYVFITMICITYLFEGRLRNMLVVLLIGMFVSMFLLEHYFPKMLRVYDVSSQFIDRLIQIPLTLFAGFSIVRVFAKAYQEDRKKLEQYSQQMTYLSKIDSLTGAYNRRAFDDYIDNCINQGQKRTLILMDVDRFKHINDTFGHLVGDDTLKFIVNMLQDQFESHAFVSRWGGDELSVVTTKPISDIHSKMASLREALKQQKFAEPFVLSMSAGITKIMPDDDVDTLLKRVDQLLYKSKSEGLGHYHIG